MSKAVGIDLGTTNSVVAVLEAGEPVVAPNSEGGRTTPSVVAFSKTGEVLVGEVAKRQAITNPDRTIRSVKRHMGTNWTIDIDGKAYNSQEISARILQKLKRDAEAYLGDSVTQAVITVPAYFGDAERQATKEAGEIAGLEVLRIINEPTAAALAYGLDKDNDQTILVFDLGGGTFDVSILDLGEGVFEVKSTAGNTHLGGDDWDQRVIDWLVSEFKNAHGVDLAADKMAVQRLKEAAEKAKIELSSLQETTVNLPFITATSDGPLHLDLTLSRAKFQADLSAPIQNKLLGPTGQHGTGLIRKSRLLRVTPRQGVPDTVLDIYVKHVSGGTSQLTLKSYDQKRLSFQGTAKHVVWLDEEPDLGIYTECLLRTMTVNGLVMCTFTPLLGLSEVVMAYLPDGKIPA